MFSSHGHRPYTVQRVALGAAKDGKLTTIVHEVTAQTSIYEDYSESVLEPARVLYASPNCTTKYRLVRGNIQSPTPMRGPGESSGAHALECAMDELAYKVNIDPLELRMRNYAGADPDTGMPWSSKNLRECYLRGAEVFGWSRRKMEPRSMREGRFLLGMGMATGLYHTGRSAASARVRIFADGTAVVQSSASDMGPGTWTMMALVGAQALGLPIERVRSELGDTSLPKAPVHGGSITTASVGSAVHEACLAARAEILELAARDPGSPLHGATGDQVLFEGGRISLKYDPARAQTLSEILQRNQRDSVEATVESSPSEEAKKFSKQAFAAHFAEVRVDPELGVVRVSRFVCAASAGRIINEKIAHSQLVGGIVGGLGMALMEETVMDHRRGRFVNPTLAEYHVPVNADVPEIEAFFVEERDDVVNPLGAKGIAELSLVGVSAAIANAVYHATGKRVRKLPITLDKLL